MCMYILTIPVPKRKHWPFPAASVHPLRMETPSTKHSFRVQGSGSRVQGAGFRIKGMCFRVSGFRFRNLDSRACRKAGSVHCAGRVKSVVSLVRGFWSRVSGFGVRILGSGFRISGEAQWVRTCRTGVPQSSKNTPPWTLQ